MKLSVAWANSVAQNVTLKVALFSLSACCLVLATASVKLALKPPIIIERGCYSTSVQNASSEHSRTEIEAFVKEALQQRFASNATVSGDLLSADEVSSRSQEQKDLASKAMSQFVIVRLMDTKDGVVNVQADRLISVGEIRSAFAFVLTATLRSTERSVGNPYGLQLSNITPVKKSGS